MILWLPREDLVLGAQSHGGEQLARRRLAGRREPVHLVELPEQRRLPDGDPAYPELRIVRMLWTLRRSLRRSRQPRRRG